MQQDDFALMVTLTLRCQLIDDDDNNSVGTLNVRAKAGETAGLVLARLFTSSMGGQLGSHEAKVTDHVYSITQGLVLLAVTLGGKS